MNLSGVSATLLAVLLVTAPVFPAQDHLVRLADVQRQAAAATQSREASLRSLDKLFTLAPAGKALHSAGMNPADIHRAASMLSDEELAGLAARADKVNSQFAAGALSNEHLTYIVIALGTAVLILVIVAAR
jgi:hypothetical protein